MGSGLGPGSRSASVPGAAAGPRRGRPAPPRAAARLSSPERTRRLPQTGSVPPAMGSRRRAAARAPSKLLERIDDLVDHLAIRIVSRAIEHAQQRQPAVQREARVPAFTPPLLEE